MKKFCAPCLIIGSLLGGGCTKLPEDIVDKTGVTPGLLSSNSTVRPGSLALVVVGEVSRKLQDRAGLTPEQARLASLKALNAVEEGKTAALRLTNSENATPFDDDIQRFLAQAAKGFMSGIGSIADSKNPLSAAQINAAMVAVSGGVVESIGTHSSDIASTGKTALVGDVTRGLTSGLSDALPSSSSDAPDPAQGKGLKAIMASTVSSLDRVGMLEGAEATVLSGAVVSGGIGGLSNVPSISSKGAEGYGEVVDDLMFGTTSALADTEISDAGKNTLLTSTFSSASASLSTLTVTPGSAESSLGLTSSPRPLTSTEIAQLMGSLVKGGVAAMAEKKDGRSPAALQNSLGALVKGTLQGFSGTSLPFAERGQVVTAISGAAVSNANSLNLAGKALPQLVDEVVAQTAVALFDLGYNREKENDRGQIMADVVAGVYRGLKESGKSNDELNTLVKPMIGKVFTNIDTDKFNATQVETIKTYFNTSMLKTFARDPVIAAPLDEKVLTSVTNAAASGAPLPAGNIIASIAPVDPGPEITGATISISAGAAYTTTTTVTLTLSATNAAEMYITNTADCSSGGSYETYATSRLWQLTVSAATARVYVKFKNSNGTESSCISDAIGYDATAPSTVSNLVDGTTAPLATSPTITWTAATDADSGIASYELAIGSGAGQTNIKAWTTIGKVTSYQATGLAMSAYQTYYASVKAKDEAGNTGSSTSGDGFITYYSASKLSLGNGYTCSVVDGGKLKCWGYAANGEIGRGNTASVGNASNQMGANLSLVDLGSGVTVSALSSGNSHNCGVTNTTTVLCWGSNGSGQLGRGDTTTRGNSAGQMGSNLVAVPLGTGKTASAVSTGYSFSCALLNDATVKCWGNNSSGQLGQQHLNSLGDNGGELGDSLSAINLGTGRTATKVRSGAKGYFACAFLDNASLKCWGDNSMGQLGHGAAYASRGGSGGEMGDSLPATNLGSGRTIKDYALADDSVCALLDNDTVKCWGRNTYGELGQGNTTSLGTSGAQMGDNLSTIDLGSGRKATALSGGTSFFCALLDNGSVKCWGHNPNGELGLGDTNDRGDNSGEMGDSLPTVSLGSGRTAKGIYSGPSHTCAILDNDRVKCWGLNADGALGQGSTTTLGDGPGEMGDNLPFINL